MLIFSCNARVMTPPFSLPTARPAVELGRMPTMSITNTKSDNIHPKVVMGAQKSCTWSCNSANRCPVQVTIDTQEHTLDSDVVFWRVGAKYDACRMRVYAKNGNAFPFNVIVPKPNGTTNVTVYNGNNALPLRARVTTNNISKPVNAASVAIEGGKILHATQIARDSILQIILTPNCETRLINARLELLQDSTDTICQVVEVFADNTPVLYRINCTEPLVMRIVNTDPTSEHTLHASVALV